MTTLGQGVTGDPTNTVKDYDVGMADVRVAAVTSPPSPLGQLEALFRRLLTGTTALAQ